MLIEREWDNAVLKEGLGKNVLKERMGKSLLRERLGKHYAEREIVGTLC